MTSTSLFRAESLVPGAGKARGEIILARPFSFAVLAAIAVAATGAILTLLVFGEYTKKAKVAGYIVPSRGLMKISAAPGSVVSSVLVNEGQAVAKGDLLAIVDSEQSIAGGGGYAETQRQIALRRESLKVQRDRLARLHANDTMSLQGQVAKLRDELEQLAGNGALLASRLKIAESMLASNRKLRDQGFVSQLSLDQRERDMLLERGSAAQLERERTAAERQLIAAQAELAALPIRYENELATLDRSLAALEQDRIESEMRRELRLVAPQSGTIAVLQATPGKAVSAGQPLMSLLPRDASLNAEVYVPSRAAGFVRPGMTALLQYQSFPFQKFGSYKARVARISRTAVPPAELPFPAQAGDLYYIATLELEKQTVTAYGREMELQPGMGVDASILLDRRRLLEWAFEPLFAISGRWG